jgi:prepilin-type processing-associated H-X9-DG protein
VNPPHNRTRSSTHCRPSLTTGPPHPNPTGAFTLIEAILVTAVVGLLAALMLPALARSHAAARRVQCLANLQQLGLAARFYWDDHNGDTFRYRGPATNGGDLYWFGWLERGREGDRRFDRSQGPLHPYITTDTISLCPALNRSLREFKLKATGAAFGYGYNLHLSAPAAEPPINIDRLPRPSGLAFLADAAQVNDFQPPASPSRPMLEEFYYVNTTEPTAHFRHARQAQAVFLDGHVSTERWVGGSLDPRLPQHFVARLRPESLRPHDEH